MKNKKVYLVSGGLDSYLAYKLFSKDIDVPLFVRLGHKYEIKELQTCEKLYEKLEVIGFGNYSILEIENNYIPNRNLLLATIAVSYFEVNQIVISGLKDDNCKDKTPESFKEYSDILTKYSKRKIEITSPFWNVTKKEAISKYLRKGFDKDILNKTISCYSSINGRCGNCEACFRWFIALEDNGIKTGLELSKKIVSKYLENINIYDEKRQKSIINVLKKYNYV